MLSSPPSLEVSLRNDLIIFQTVACQLSFCDSCWWRELHFTHNVNIKWNGEQMSSSLFRLGQENDKWIKLNTFVPLARSLNDIPELSLNGSGKIRQLGPTKHLVWKKNEIFCIIGYTLLQTIHCIQSKILFFGNPNWYIEWPCAVNSWYLVYHLDLRTPKCAEDSQAIDTQERLFLSFKFSSNCSVKQ